MNLKIDNVGKVSEVIARNEREYDRIWNAAIEAAIGVIRDKQYNDALNLLKHVRKLKK